MPPEIQTIKNKDTNEVEYYKIYKRPYYCARTLNNPDMIIYRRNRCNSIGKLLNDDGTTKIRKKRVTKGIRTDKGGKHRYKSNRK